KTDSTQLVTHSYSGIYTETKVQLNGAVTGEVVSHYNSSSNSYQLMTVGRPNNAHDYFGNFEIAEIIAIASDNPQKIIEIQNYLSNKWNLTSTVDSDGDGFVDTVDPEPTQSSLLAHYKFNGNANDSSGNNLDGVVHNATLTADRFNNSDKAYSFDGSSYIEIPDDPILTNTASLSISAWFKPVSSSNWTVILQKGSHDSDEEYILAVTDQQVYFDVGASSGPYLQ
ncbi:MAG: LamG-like jellyroll fold domain-containing protein, partial [Deltaproteobacteria bacterium]